MGDTIFCEINGHLENGVCMGMLGIKIIVKMVDMLRDRRHKGNWKVLGHV